MLSTKGWLETRLLLLVALFFFALNIASELVRMAQPLANPAPALMDFLVLWVFVPPLMAGNGIRTPAKFRASADSHSSMYLTLSLPVSRFRLLAVRAFIGMMETAAVVIFGVGAIWIFLPSFRINASPQDAVLYTLTLLAHTGGFYFLSVLLATVIEGPWRVWGTFLLIFGVRWTTMHLLPRSFDILAPIASETPLITHALPWKAISLCIGMAAICFAAASKVVESREY